MPYETISTWVDPDVMTTHKGVTVYRVYDDDDVTNGPLDYWFTLDPRFHDWDGVDGKLSFDVRYLPGYTEPNLDVDPATGRRIMCGQVLDRHICAFIERAIEDGIITEEGVQ